jgi:AraC-like DNA-binding protein
VIDDEQLRSWEFVVAPPRSAPGVTSMVGYRALEVSEGVHRGMPSATLTFIVSLDDGVEVAHTADALAVARPIPLILGGLHVRPSHVRQRRGQAGVQLAVHPLASRSLFGVPSAELSVTDFDAAAVLSRRTTELRDRVADAQHWPDVFGLVAGYLVGSRQQRGSATVRPEVAYAWHLLERSHGKVPVGSVADKVGLTARHLTTLFRQEVGRSPKTVAMLMRFEHATARIADSVRQRGRVALAGVAADTGYCDQAHLSREFVRFAGVPPRRWLTEEFRNIQDGGHSGSSQWDHDCFESDRLVDPASH